MVLWCEYYKSAALPECRDGRPVVQKGAMLLNVLRLSDDLSITSRWESEESEGAVQVVDSV